MNATVRWILVSALLVLVGAACSKDPVTPPGDEQPVSSLGIGEPLLINASDRQNPALSNNNQHTFDLSSLALVQSGEFGDFEMRYSTSNSCDEDVDVFNFATNDWDIITERPDNPVCSPVGTNWSRTLSEQALVADEFLNDSYEMVIRTFRTPTVRALKLNPNYNPIALNPFDIFASGIHVEGSTIWLAGANLHRVTTSGSQQPDITTSLAYHSGLAFDDQLYWTVDRSVTPWGRFYGFTPQGVESCSFAGSDDWETNDGMCYARELLWACRSGHYQLTGIDLATSCTDDFIKESEIIQFPFQEVGTALTYDGTNFYVLAGENIEKISPAGLALESYPLTVEDIVDMVYVNGSLWILHTGPKGVITGGQFLTKFEL